MSIEADISALDLKISKINTDCERNYENLQQIRETLEAMRDNMNRRIENMLVETKNAETLNRRLEEALSASREELKTATDITIPGLIASSRVLMNRWEAESSILAIKNAIAQEER